MVREEGLRSETSARAVVGGEAEGGAAGRVGSDTKVPMVQPMDHILAMEEGAVREKGSDAEHLLRRRQKSTKEWSGQLEGDKRWRS